jgi:hypothetical protein
VVAFRFGGWDSIWSDGEPEQSDMLAIRCRRLVSVNTVDPKDEEFRTIHRRGVRGRAPVMYFEFHKSGFSCLG